MREFIRTTLLVVAVVVGGGGCDSGPAQPTGQARSDAQNAAQTQAEDDEKQNQAEGKKMTGTKKK